MLRWRNIWVKIAVLRNRRRKAGCAQRNTRFWASAKKNVAAIFFAVGFLGASFFEFVVKWAEKISRPIFLFAVVNTTKVTPFAIRRRLLLFFRHFLLFAVAENKLKDAFRYSL